VARSARRIFDNYAYAVVDVYLLDPASLTLNPPRTLPGRYPRLICRRLDARILDPNPDAFLFDLNTFSIPLDSQVVVSVTYSPDPKATQAGRAPDRSVVQSGHG